MSESLDESKRNRRTAKRILAIGLPLVVIAATGVGYAYWTTTGVGGGSATAAAGASGVTLSADAVGTLVPGGSVTVDITATNPNSKTSVSIGNIIIGAITSDGGSACDSVAHVIADRTVLVGVRVPPNNGTAKVGTLTISMGDDQTDNQDPCMGKKFSVALSA